MKTPLQRLYFSILIFGVSFSIRFLAVQQTEHAPGWDGYFYINQVRSFLEEGKMDVPDASLIYPLLIAVQVVAQNYILSFKIVVCALAALFSVSLFLLSLRWSDNNSASLIPASISLFSPHLTYFAAQYPKNLLGVIFFMWLLYTLDSRIKFLPLALLIVNFFGHRVTAVLSFVVLFLHHTVFKLKRSLLLVVITFIAIFCAAAFWVPGILNWFDAERFSGIFSATPVFAPYAFIQTFGHELISPFWLAEIVALSLLFVFSIGYAIRLAIHKRTDMRLAIVLIILCLLIFPFFHWSLSSASFRFCLIFILLCPVLIIFFLKYINHQRVVAVLAIVPLSLCFFSYKSYQPEKHDPPYSLYNTMSEQIALYSKPSSCDLIIAHKSLAEYIVYATKIDAMSWLPEYPVDIPKLWRVASDVKDVQLNFYLDPGDMKFIHRLTPSYCFIREDVWQKFLERVKKDGDEELWSELMTWKNPQTVRPNYLLKRKSSGHPG
jgi:hypothetical protein